MRPAISRHGILLVTVALAFLAAGAGLGFLVRGGDGGGTEAATKPDIGNVKVVHWNICGAAHGCRTRGSTGPGSSVARLIGEVTERRPHVLSVNEICRAQFGYIERELKALGYAMHGSFAPAQGNVSNCGTDGSFGLALFAARPFRDTPEYVHFTETEQELYTGAGREEPVRRGLFCGTTTAGDLSLRACTTHTSARPRQVAQLPGLLGHSAPVVLAGDLNHRPEAEPLDGLYARFTEADERATPTAANGRKIDYIFATRNHVVGRRTSVISLPESDHRLLEAEFHLTQSPRD